MTPQISVIIPCFNGSLTIERAVNSVLSQTGVDMQVVIVDDASTDDSFKVAHRLLLKENNLSPTLADVRETLADSGVVLSPRVIVEHQAENKRQGFALNRAQEFAKGDYFLRLDQDDWLEPGSLSALKSALDNNPDAAFAYGAIQYHGRRSDLVKPTPFSPSDFYRHNASGYCYLFRRSVYEASIRYEETGDLVNLGDWVHALDMVEAGYKGIALPDVTVLNYVYGWTGTSTTLKENEAAVLASFKARYAGIKAVTL